MSAEIENNEPYKFHYLKNKDRKREFPIFDLKNIKDTQNESNK